MLTAMPVRVALPGFDSVRVCTALVVLTVVEGKATVDGVRTA